jgi:ADP-ribose pyrophosphatase YjhB (NUDIX family)
MQELMRMPIPQWLDWAQRLQAIAQTGLNYNPPPFDRERYELVRDIAAEMMASNGSTDHAALATLFVDQAGHATPKIDVRGVVFRDDKILLVQERMDGNRWTLPGGWADIGESAGEGVVREIYEESGYRTRAIKLLALYDRNKHDHPPFAFHAYKAFFRCELTDPDRHLDLEASSASFSETVDVDFFAEDDIPELSTARVTYQQIARFYEHLRQPDLPTDFD